LPMLTPSERAEAERGALEKCATFEQVINAILDAGIGGPDGILLFDTDGNLWKKQPDQMNPDDVVEYVQMKFGPLFASFVKEFPQFIIH
jgi:hypothetical protein